MEQRARKVLLEVLHGGWLAHLLLSALGAGLLRVRGCQAWSGVGTECPPCFPLRERYWCMLQPAASLAVSRAIAALCVQLSLSRLSIKLPCHPNALAGLPGWAPAAALLDYSPSQQLSSLALHFLGAAALSSALYCTCVAVTWAAHALAAVHAALPPPLPPTAAAGPGSAAAAAAKQAVFQPVGQPRRSSSMSWICRLSQGKRQRVSQGFKFARCWCMYLSAN